MSSSIILCFIKILYGSRNFWPKQDMFFLFMKDATRIYSRDSLLVLKKGGALPLAGSLFHSTDYVALTEVLLPANFEQSNLRR